jgi:hypothetical protein
MSDKVSANPFKLEDYAEAGRELTPDLERTVEDAVEALQRLRNQSSDHLRHILNRDDELQDYPRRARDIDDFVQRVADRFFDLYVNVPMKKRE